MTPNLATSTDPRVTRRRVVPRATEVDAYVGGRIRERRVAIGITQGQLAELIGLTYQQMHKYESGINRVAASRLYQIAQALDCEVGDFFDGLNGPRPQADKVGAAMVELGQSYRALTPEHQALVSEVARRLRP